VLLALLSKQQCDNLLLEIMEFLGTHEFTRNAIYEGVCLGGNSSFESDQAQGPAAFMDLVTLAKFAAT
jgi:ubiquinone biosynthesis protein COQ9